jgi:hypothetical protein
MSKLSDFEFNEHVEDVRMFVVRNAEEIGFDMTWYQATFVPKLLKWTTAFGAWFATEDRTHLLTANKNASREELEPEFALMVRMLKSLPKVTKAQLESLKIATGGGGYHPALPPPGLAPILVLVAAAAGVVEIHVYNAANLKRGKPPGGKGCFAMYVVLPSSAPAPTTPEELTERIYISAGKGVIELPRAKRGEIVYVMGHWVNATGESGPWSEMVSTVVL